MDFRQNFDFDAESAVVSVQVVRRRLVSAIDHDMSLFSRLAHASNHDDHLLEDHSFIIRSSLPNVALASPRARYRIMVASKYWSDSTPFVVELLSAIVPLSIEIYSDLAEFLLKVGGEPPDAFIVCPDDFDVDVRVLADSLCSDALGMRAKQVVVFRRSKACHRRRIGSASPKQLLLSERDTRGAIQSFLKFLRTARPAPAARCEL